MRWADASDEALLAATGDDGDAFVAFYDRYETAVVGYMLRRTHDVELAVDLASEVFARALAGASGYVPARSSAAAWLFTIAHNTLADSLRRGRVEAQARRRIGIRDAVQYSDEDLERIETLASQPDWATRLLGRLPAEQRDAIQARIIDERAYLEIASEMKTSALVVRKRVSRGLATLRNQLKEDT